MEEAARVCYEYEWWKLRTDFAPLASNLVALGVGEPLLNRILDLEGLSQRPVALSILALVLSAPLAMKAIDALMQARLELSEWTDQARALTHLGTFLPRAEQAGLVSTVLNIAKSAPEWGWENRGSWLGMLPELYGMLPNLPEALQVDMVDDLGRYAREYSDDFRPWVRRLLAEALSKVVVPLRDRVLGEIIESVQAAGGPQDRAEAMRDIAPYLSEEARATVATRVGEVVGLLEYSAASNMTPEPDAPYHLVGLSLLVGLSEACTINSGRGYRAEVLKRLVPSLMLAPIPERYALWRQALHDLATQRSRANLLADLAELAPVIDSLGGPTATRAICHSIVAIHHDFP